MYEELCKYAVAKRDATPKREWDGNVPANYKTEEQKVNENEIILLLFFNSYFYIFKCEGMTSHNQKIFLTKSS